jgi:hypothetical protein
VHYCQSFTNKDPESTAVHDNEAENGTETGKCPFIPFIVHGVTGEQYSTSKLSKQLDTMRILSQSTTMSSFFLK